MEHPQLAKVELTRLAAALRAAGAEIESQLAAIDREGSGDPLGVPMHDVIARIAQEMEAGSGSAALSARSATSPPEGWATPDRIFAAGLALWAAMLVQIPKSLGRDLLAAESAALRGRLDALLVERIAASVQRQREQAECAADAQARYMSFLSHDLRGSLNGIVLMLEVMRRELAPRKELAETLADIALMRKSISEAVALMERHILMERLRRGRVVANPGPVDIRHVVGEVTSSLDVEARPQLSAVLPEHATVVADEEMLRVALREVLGNVIKHGEGRAAITAQRRGDSWILSIQDQGRGIDPQRLVRHLDPNRRHESKERGIGLALAQQALGLFGGRVEGESGEGVTIRLVMPAG